MMPFSFICRNSMLPELPYAERLYKKPTVITYHCDLLMPPGPIPQLANLAVKVANNLAALWTHRIVTYTRDYAEHSSYLRRYLDKLQVIQPPVELPDVTTEEIKNLPAYIIHSNNDQ